MIYYCNNCNIRYGANFHSFCICDLGELNGVFRRVGSLHSCK